MARAVLGRMPRMSSEETPGDRRMLLIADLSDQRTSLCSTRQMAVQLISGLATLFEW